MTNTAHDFPGQFSAQGPVMSSTSPTVHEELPARCGLGRGLWRAGEIRAFIAAVAVGLLCAGAASSAQAADICANASQRAQNGSTELPDCRAYEMVSPPYKEGFGVDPARFTDGGIVSYTSTGSFAGNNQGMATNLYHATRSPAGWITTAPSPPGVLFDTYGEGTRAESADLSSSLWRMRRRDQPLGVADLYVRGPDGIFSRVGQGAILGVDATTPIVRQTSADLSHLVFNTGEAGSGASTALYEYVGTGNTGPARAVSVDNNGQPTAAETCPQGISDDGRVIVFASGCRIGTPRLWARVDGSATVAVSGSECTRTAEDPGGACNDLSSADYAGSADDGSRVFFTTSQQLVNGDTDVTSDLYACDIPAGTPAPVGSANPCAALTQVSGTASGAQVQNVVAISDDGSRVYFVAKGVLADNLGLGDSGPHTGADNLYLWQRDAAHPAGHTTFVTGLVANDLSRPQMTPDGRYLLFNTSNALSTGPAADGDTASDVYRYDADTKSIVRVSTAVSGVGGNDSAFDASVAREDFAMTDDGSSIVFDTREGLAPSDTDGVTDVYAWHDGHVSLISNGGGNALWISPSGRDIFFTTAVPLVAGDRDVNADIYTARIGGGFDVPQTEPCSGDACRGQQSLPPSLAGPPAPPSLNPGPAEAAPSITLRKVSTAQRKRLAATGKVTLTTTTNAPGTISITAIATIAGRSVTVASARRVLSAPGTTTLSLTLSKKARTQLAARGKLSVNVAVSHSKVALDRSLTFRLVHAKARRKAATGSHARRAAVSSDRSQS